MSKRIEEARRGGLLEMSQFLCEVFSLTEKPTEKEGERKSDLV
jgi:dTDP-glucose pyrophosphorylase